MNQTAQSNSKFPNLESVANLMARIGLLETQINEGIKDEQYFNNIQPVALGLFRLVIMGEIKKGKSSFINALCGIRDMVPVHDNVATSTIFKIYQGDQLGYTVFFQRETGKEKLEISPKELGDYGTEYGNPNNEKMVDFIAVRSPSFILHDGLILIDTPGVGGLFKKHREITFRYAPKADAIFFITDSEESPIGSEEINFLKELRKITSLVYFVQTKGAKVDPEDRKKLMDNNVAILTDKAGIPKDEIRYFVVDSNLKIEADASKCREDLEDSGFPPLISYLYNVLKPSRDRNIVTVGLRRASTKLAEIRSIVEKQKLILDADTGEKQALLSKDLRKIEDKINIWNSETRPQLVKEFQIQVYEIQTKATELLSEKLRPGGEISEEVGNILEKVKDEAPEDIYKMAEQLVNNTRSAASQLMVQLSQDLESQFSDLMSALSRKADAQIVTLVVNSNHSEQDIIIHYADAQLKQLVAKGEETEWFEKTRTGLYGGLAGVTIAQFVGGVIGSVVPIVGTVVGSLAGTAIAGIWGGYKLSKIVQKKESNAARQSVYNFVEKDLSLILNQMQSLINKSINKLRVEAEDALGNMVKASMSQLSQTRIKLQERVRATTHEINQSRQKVDALERQVTAFEQELKAVESMWSKV